VFRFETLSDLIVGILVTLSFNHVVLTQANLAQHNIYYWCSGASAAPNLHVPAKESRGKSSARCLARTSPQLLNSLTMPGAGSFL
jgi:hypothetical protein